MKNPKKDVLSKMHQWNGTKHYFLEKVHAVHICRSICIRKNTFDIDKNGT